VTDDPTLFDEADLAPSEDELTAADIRHPGLYPRYTFFHVTARTEYLSLISKKINWLGSVYSLTQGYTKGAPTDNWLREAEKHAKDARIAFIDSGAISTLLRFARGKGTQDDIRNWLERHDLVVDTAWRLYKAGVETGIVAAMDLPSTAIPLEDAGFTWEEGLDITFKNAVRMSESSIPPGWKPIYMVQGREPDEFVRCAQMFDEAGLLNQVREGNAWLGIGGIHKVKSPTLDNIIKAVRNELGPDGHIHALGLAGPRSAPFAARNIINSSDASTTQMQVTKNLPPYRIEGPRPTFLLNALWAAGFLRHDTILARKIAALEAQEMRDQDEIPLEA
jgi:hypothetical protein